MSLALMESRLPTTHELILEGVWEEGDLYWSALEQWRENIVRAGAVIVPGQPAGRMKTLPSWTKSRDNRVPEGYELITKGTWQPEDLFFSHASEAWLKVTSRMGNSILPHAPAARRRSLLERTIPEWASW